MDDNYWINDAEHKCSTCETVFKVYCLDDMPNVNFCPCCGSSQLDKNPRIEEV